MGNQVTTLIVDHDLNFVELVKNAIERTDNLFLIGNASDREEVETLCNKFKPSLVLLNINIEYPGYQEFIKVIRNNIPDSFIILMNLDEKKFGTFNPEDKVADDYLDKYDLFNEIIKVSIYFEKQLNNKLLRI